MTRRIPCRLLIAPLLMCLLAATAVAQESEDPQPAAPQPVPEQELEAPQAVEAPLTLDDARLLLARGRATAALAILRSLPLDGEDRVNILFQTGMAAMAVAQVEGLSGQGQGALLDEAIAAFRAILVDNPELVRVRLELARAFFLKGQDRLAQRHFELVLGGELPLPVFLNIRNFLEVIRQRKRLTGYFGAAIAPDSNLNVASEEDIIYLDTVFGRLPFQREGAEIERRSGLGLSVWGGGEYQQPFGESLRLRAGADLAQRDYSGRDFDQTFLAAHAGPRWLVSPRTDISLLATGHRQWLGNLPQIDEYGGRLEIDHQLGARFWLRGSAGTSERECHNCEWRNGPQTAFSLGAIWTPAPVLQVHMTLGYERDHASQVHWRSLTRWLRAGGVLALPLGFNLGGTAQMRRTHYDGDGRAHFTLFGRPRRDRTFSFTVTLLNRAIAFFGFSPQLALVHEARRTNAQAQDFERNRAELRMVRQF